MSHPLIDGQSARSADLTFRLWGSNAIADVPQASDAYHGIRDRKLLLVHGYNVREVSGQRSMHRLRDAIGARCAALGDRCLTVTWAGNASLLQGERLRYAAKVPVAVQTAEAFHNHLVRHYRNGGGARQLIIVAHSLGCRVTMELLRRLGGSGRPAVLEQIVVILMAAAVPIEQIDLIDRALTTADKLVVLHSQADSTLRRFFSIGQRIAGEPSREAVGLAGNPRLSDWSYERAMIVLDHGEYWASSFVADVICQKLREYFPDVLLRRDLGAEHALRTTAPLGETEFLAMSSIWMRPALPF